MKRKMMLLLGIMVLGFGLVGTPASWANSLTYQNVTFGLNIVGGNLQLGVSAGATPPSGDWAGINGLAAFEVKDIGTALGLALTSWTNFNDSLSSNGCTGGNTSGGCFVRNAGPIAFGANTSLLFTLTKSSGTFDLTNNHLKVLFTRNGATTFYTDTHGKKSEPHASITEKTGSLLSTNIPGTSVPEPASLMLLGAGLAGIGIWRRKSAKS